MLEGKVRCSRMSPMVRSILLFLFMFSSFSGVLPGAAAGQTDDGACARYLDRNVWPASHDPDRRRPLARDIGHLKWLACRRDAPPLDTLFHHGTLVDLLAPFGLADRQGAPTSAALAAFCGASDARIVERLSETTIRHLHQTLLGHAMTCFNESRRVEIYATLFTQDSPWSDTTPLHRLFAIANHNAGRTRLKALRLPAGRAECHAASTPRIGARLGEAPIQCRRLDDGALDIAVEIANPDRLFAMGLRAAAPIGR